VFVDTDKVLGIYADADTTFTAKVLSLTGTSISAGAEGSVVFSQPTNPYPANFNNYQLTTNKVICMAPAGASGRKDEAVIATVSGTTVTFGTPVKLIWSFPGSIGGGQYTRLIPCSSTLCYVVNRSVAMAVNISGTTITTGNRWYMLGSSQMLDYIAAGTSFGICARLGGVGVSMERAVLSAHKLTAQGIFCFGPAMSISWDGATYSIWNGSAARAIASNSSAIHGGTNGVWYYRNSASVWAAATSNTAVQALIQAQAYSANVMSIDEMRTMSSANWVTMGFLEATYSYMYVAFVNVGENARGISPCWIDHIAFTYTSRARWDQATQNYVINMGAEDQATITKSTAGTASIKAVIMGPET
jgi:hypothetical protein